MRVIQATAIILAGGGSRRMGQDKADIPFGNATLLEHVTGRLAGLCDEIVIAGARRPGQSFAGLDPIWVSDTPGATGPVAGLAAGLAIATHPYVIVVGCDMPFLNLDLLRRLLDLARLGDAAVPYSGGRAQPLHAVYTRQCLPVAESLLREVGSDSTSAVWPAYQPPFYFTGTIKQVKIEVHRDAPPPSAEDAAAQDRADMIRQ